MSNIATWSALSSGLLPTSSRFRCAGSPGLDILESEATTMASAAVTLERLADLI